MSISLRRLFFSFVVLGTVPLALADITLYAFQPAAAAAVGALNARPDREKYTLSNKPLPGKSTIPRWRKPLNISKMPKDAPLSRTSLAIVVDKSGTVVDVAAFNFNDTEFADQLIKIIPQMIAFVPNKTKKHERALFVLTFNTRSEDPEEFVVGPAR
jgi:hypothetical protein